MKIDVAIPSYGDTNLDECINCLIASEACSPFEIDTVYFDFRYTKNIGENILEVRKILNKNNTDINISVANRNLPESREFLINRISTDWFLFLDGDVMLGVNTLSEIYKSISKNIGGVQSRRFTDNDPNWKWSYRRAVRGTLFCTLIRKRAVEGIEIPSDMTVLEDEYIRQYVEENNYLWIFNHQSKFKHKSEQRHKIDFNEGYIAGKYGLLPYDYIFLHIPFAIMTKRSPVRFTKRALGYCYGLMKR